MNSKSFAIGELFNNFANINDTKLLPSLRWRCRLADGREQKAKKKLSCTEIYKNI